jgi:ankyrin repeat protein
MPLHAITESGENKVNELLQYSSPLLTARTYREGKSALHLACHSRNPLKMIQMLVDHGADPTWVDNNGNTLLHEVATRFGGFAEDIALVEELIELGVPIRALNWQRRTAWHILRPFDAVNDSSRDKASRQGMFSVLLRHDPDIDLNAKDIDGYTPLHLAASSSEAQTFNLLQAGACISAKAFNLRTPLHCAARARKSNILAMLLDHANEAATSDQALDVDAKDKGDRTPLHDACRSGRPESVRILLDHGACAGQPYDRPASAFVDSRSPLMACTEFVQEDKLWSCLRSGTAPLDEFRPIMLKSGHRQSSKEDKEQHDTVRIGPIASMLLETGARDQYALQAAVKAKSTALVAAFREKTPSTSRGFDEAHLMFAVNNVAKVFDASKYKDLMESPALYVSEVDEATLDEMIARGVDLAKDEFSGTALGVLASNGMTEKMIKVIDKAKIHDDSPSCKEIGKFRPLLHIACDRPVLNMEMVKLLVIKGHADVNACHQVKEKEKDGWRETGNYIPGPTALHVLAKGNHWWQVEAIKFLVQNGWLLSLILMLVLTKNARRRS